MRVPQGMMPLFAFEEETEEKQVTGDLFELLPKKKKKEPVGAHKVEPVSVLETCPVCRSGDWKELVAVQSGEPMCTMCSWDFLSSVRGCETEPRLERVRLVRYLDGDNHPVANLLSVTDFGWLVWTFESGFYGTPWNSLLIAETNIPTAWTRREAVHLTENAFRQITPPPWNTTDEPASGAWMQLGFGVEVDDDRKR